jgi:hypothetical protein
MNKDHFDDIVQSGQVHREYLSHVYCSLHSGHLYRRTMIDRHCRAADLGDPGSNPGVVFILFCGLHMCETGPGIVDSRPRLSGQVVI